MSTEAESTSGTSGTDGTGSTDGAGESGGAGGGGGGSASFKSMNIVEHQDVGVPLRMAYDQWTQFADFPGFMKKVETVDQESDEKINWKAQVFWSHRTWETTILEQIPDTHIVWRSTGAKGHADGIVSFHELAPRLTRILLVLEYHPQGFFEKTGNLWRAVGRRARLEFKHFARNLMAHTMLTPAEDLQGWRGEIRDSEVVKTHEEALEEEEQAGSAEHRDEPVDEEDGVRGADTDQAEAAEPGTDEAENESGDDDADADADAVDHADAADDGETAVEAEEDTAPPGGEEPTAPRRTGTRKGRSRRTARA